MKKSLLHELLKSSPEVKKILVKKAREEFRKRVDDLSDDEILQMAGDLKDVNLSVLLDKKEQNEKILDTPLEDLDISVRAYNCLKAAKVNNLRQYMQYPVEELLKLRNFGKKSLVEIEELLEMHGIKHQE